MPSTIQDPNESLQQFNQGQHLSESLTYQWDVATLLWVRGTQAGGGGGGAVTIADGADVAEGALADAAVVTDAAGTISGKLRGLVKWAFERMPASLGQKVMASSFPVTIASDQTALAVSGTVAVTQSTVPWAENVSQFGGNVVVTGTGVSGVGIPRVTVASDSSITANAGTNLNTSLLLLDTTFTGRINTQGQKTSAASTPIVIASDQSAVPVTVSALVPGTGATNLGKAEDSLAVEGDTGVAMLGVREDILLVDQASSGDYGWLKLDNKGRLYIAADLMQAQLEAQINLLRELVTETKVHTSLLVTGLNVRDDVELYRADPYYQSVN